MACSCMLWVKVMALVNPQKKLGLVLSGGGARGAYEAGVMHYLRTMLPKEIGQKRGFDILCGSSVGAINTCFLAATAHDLRYQGVHIYELWKHLRQEDIYKRDTKNFFKFLYSSVLGIAKNVFSKKYDEQTRQRSKNIFKGMLNTAPFYPFLKKNFPWKQISVNIANGYFDAMSLTVTNVATGKLELFIEKRKDHPYTGRYRHHLTKIEAIHAMASAALPLVFPAIKIEGVYYMDGGIRMNTPMSPAIQLGAEKILVVGVHHKKESPQQVQYEPIAPTQTIEQAPTIGNLLGTILDSLFLDKLDYDIEQLHRINRLITWGENCFGPDFIQKINTYLHDKRVHGDIAARGLKKMEVFKIFPSQDLRDIFVDAVEKSNFFRNNLTKFEKTLLKILDVDVRTGKGFLSFVMFCPEYIHRLLELGFEDARKNHDRLAAFFSN